jgi:hypothetical protein
MTATVGLSDDGEVGTGDMTRLLSEPPRKASRPAVQKSAKSMEKTWAERQKKKPRPKARPVI